MMVTKKDMELLNALVEIHSFGPDADAAARLGAKLACASVVASDEVPLDLVTMNGSRDRVSVLSPVGRALLGLTVGERIDRPITHGANRQLTVVAITYQPESLERAAAAQRTEDPSLAANAS